MKRGKRGPERQEPSGGLHDASFVRCARMILSQGTTACFPAMQQGSGTRPNLRLAALPPQHLKGETSWHGRKARKSDRLACWTWLVCAPPGLSRRVRCWLFDATRRSRWVCPVFKPRLGYRNAISLHSLTTSCAQVIHELSSIAQHVVYLKRKLADSRSNPLQKSL